MTQLLEVSIGQCSLAGRKEVNQDFYGAYVPAGAPLASKGISLALADGISTSNVNKTNLRYGHNTALSNMI